MIPVYVRCQSAIVIHCWLSAKKNLRHNKIESIDEDKVISTQIEWIGKQEIHWIDNNTARTQLIIMLGNEILTIKANCWNQTQWFIHRQPHRKSHASIHSRWWARARCVIMRTVGSKQTKENACGMLSKPPHIIIIFFFFFFFCSLMLISRMRRTPYHRHEFSAWISVGLVLRVKSHDDNNELQ